MKTDFSDVLPEELEEKIKHAADISMGTEISDFDIANIQHLCEQVCTACHCVQRRSEPGCVADRGDKLVPQPAVRLPEEPHGRAGAQPDRAAGRAGRRPTDRPRRCAIARAIPALHYLRPAGLRLADEPGQVPGVHGADPGRREGALPGAEDEAGHAQVRADLPRPAHRPHAVQPEGQGDALGCRWRAAVT